MDNILWYGDNLEILRKHIPDESVDLIYLDPPFNSKRDYNILFKDTHGVESAAQIEAFTDSWHWDARAEATYHQLITEASPHVSKLIEAMRSFIGSNDMMAYLCMMTARLIELHRVLKPTGSIWLHCDPTASHYLKMVMDTIFGIRNYRNEIVWKRTSAHNDAHRCGPIHDILFFYSKSDQYKWTPQYMPYDESYIENFYRHVDEDGRRYRVDNLTAPGPRPGLQYTWKGVNPPAGRVWAVLPEKMEAYEREGRIIYSKTGVPQYKRYLDEMPGVSLQDVWDDISPVASQAKERLGYDTQKPLKLLERIILSASEPGDVVLDPFCGCGTAIAAAQKLGRQWIGIDITNLAISLIKYRLHDMFPEVPVIVRGEPVDAQGAKALAEQDRYQFQWWALMQVRAKPLGDNGRGVGKKGADQGVDGVITFIDDASGKGKRVLVQVKSGHVNASVIRDLVGTLDREKAEMGLLITLEEPTEPMRREAVTAGYYHSPGWNKDYPRVQVLSIERLLHGDTLQMPPYNVTFKRAERMDGEAAAGQQHQIEWQG